MAGRNKDENCQEELIIVNIFQFIPGSFDSIKYIPYWSNLSDPYIKINMADIIKSSILFVFFWFYCLPSYLDCQLNYQVALMFNKMTV